MIMNRNRFKWIPIVLILAGCSTAPALFVSNIRDLKTPEKSTFLYSLPRTVINIEVEIRKSGFIPGPYHEYADKYLAIKGIRHDPGASWKIKEIKVFASGEPDPDYFYSGNTEVESGKLAEELNMLSQKGLIMQPGDFALNGPVVAEMDIPEENEICFKDLSVKKNLAVKKQTSYKRVFRDSIYVQVPVETELLVQKTPEMKAEEAANFIIKLRKRRFKLLTGQNEGEVPVMAIDAVIDELGRIEQEYLSLFTGKTIYESETMRFKYIPVAGKLADQQVLFRISDDEGIFDATSAKGKPVILEVLCLDLTKNLKEMNTPEAARTLFYREPDLARISVSLDAEKLFENQLTVYQYGSIVSRKIKGK
jgi:hypothetical protein